MAELPKPMPPSADSAEMSGERNGHTKLRTPLKACEMCTVYSKHANKLNRFHLNCLRKVLHITQQDKVSDTIVFNLTELSFDHTPLHRAQLRWSDHFIKMDDESLQENLLCGELH